MKVNTLILAVSKLRTFCMLVHVHLKNEIIITVVSKLIYLQLVCLVFSKFKHEYWFVIWQQVGKVCGCVLVVLHISTNLMPRSRAHHIAVAALQVPRYNVCVILLFF
jgi:hypothetical protein